MDDDCCDGDECDDGSCDPPADDEPMCENIILHPKDALEFELAIEEVGNTPVMIQISKPTTSSHQYVDTQWKALANATDCRSMRFIYADIAKVRWSALSKYNLRYLPQFTVQWKQPGQDEPEILESVTGIYAEKFYALKIKYALTPDQYAQEEEGDDKEPDCKNEAFLPQS